MRRNSETVNAKICTALSHVLIICQGSMVIMRGEGKVFLVGFGLFGTGKNGWVTVNRVL
jgi:hypothetical protein